MKHITISCAMSLSALMTAPAWADKGGSCHFHGSKAATEATVLGCANQRKEQLIKADKLEKSWAGIAHEKIEQVDGKKGKEWKLSFKDKAAKDKSRETLYMFFTPPGNFIAANFNGQ